MPCHAHRTPKSSHHPRLPRPTLNLRHIAALDVSCASVAAYTNRFAAKRKWIYSNGWPPGFGGGGGTKPQKHRRILNGTVVCPTEK